MDKQITAHFDGKVLVPDGPVELPIGEPLRLQVELSTVKHPRFADLLSFGVDCPELPADLAEQHDHYLYGMPKK